jgi:hypothetical protein
MVNQITWTKKQRDRANAEGLTLYAVGYDGRGGRAETTGLMPDDKATFLWLFAHNLYRGMGPKEAFDATVALIADHEAKLAARGE